MNNIHSIHAQLNYFFNQHKLSIMLIASIVISILSGDVLRKLDITAAPIDLGILAVLPLSAMTVISFMILTGWVIAWQWPVLNEFQFTFLEQTFNSLLSWQKVSIYFCFYLAILYAFIMVASVYL